MTPRFLMEDLTNEVRDQRPSIILWTRLGGVEIRTSVYSEFSCKKYIGHSVFAVI